MIPVRLVVSDKKGEVAVFRRDKAGTQLVRASGDVRADLERWVTRGLVELVGARRNQRQRVTAATEPEFLERVAMRLQRYGFVTRLETQSATEEFAPVFKFHDMPRAPGLLSVVPSRADSSQYTVVRATA